MSMANTLLGIVLVLMLSACSAPPKVPTTEELPVRQDRGEVKKPAGIIEAQTATTPPEPRCTKQLKQGYALRARIDNEYWQRRRDGTFRDRSDDFTARWGEEAGQWADSEEPLPKRQNTDRHGEWRCEVEQYPKLSSDEIGRPHVDLQSPLASPRPMLLPVIARAMTPPNGQLPTTRYPA